MAAHKKIFISYRREGGSDLAQLVYKDLITRGYSVFMDVRQLKTGHFDEALKKQLLNCCDFILILTPGALDRCKTDVNDWVLREISIAIACNKNIVPLVTNDQKEKFNGIPSSISDLPRHNFVKYDHDKSDESLAIVRDRLFSSPSVLELLLNRHGKKILIGLFPIGLLILFIIGWVVFGRTGRIEKNVSGIEINTKLTADIAKNIQDDTKTIIRETGLIRIGVDEIEKSGGIRKNPKSLGDYVHNARIHELSGNTNEAIKNYRNAVAISWDYLDLNIIYLDILTLKEGLESATQIYESEAKHKLALPQVKIALALKQPIEKQRDILVEIAEAFPEFKPGFFYLSLTFSPKMVAQSSVLAIAKEKQSLDKFFQTNPPGNLSVYYLFRDTLEKVLHDSKERFMEISGKNLEPIVKVHLNSPTSLFWVNGGIDKAFISYNNKKWFELKSSGYLFELKSNDYLNEFHQFNFPLSSQQCRDNQFPDFKGAAEGFGQKAKKATLPSQLDGSVVDIQNNNIPLYFKFRDSIGIESGPTLVAMVSLSDLHNNYDLKTEKLISDSIVPDLFPKKTPTFPDYSINEIKINDIQKDLAKSLGTDAINFVEFVGPIKLELMLIPAGKFLMGGATNEKHEVSITKHFFIGKYEITQELWEAVEGNNPSELKGSKFPVTNVSWEDCQGFIKKLNEKTKGGYRLPTESEWEYACRAGTGTNYSFGQTVTLKDANYYDSNIKTKISAWSKFGQDFIYDDLLARCRLKTVGSYKENAFGLYDMHGNVSEWCEDWHGRYPSGPVIDPKGAETGKGRILRGGSFNANDLKISSASRDNRYVPTNRHCTYGFRIVKNQLP